MASAFAHIVVPAVAYAAFKGRFISARLFVLAAMLSVAPDIDVLAFKFGIPYESQWGHRGFTHSLFFAGLVALFCTLFWRAMKSHPIAVFLICFIACSSHALLDGLTNGGLGVALFWPFDNTRYFLPHRPVEVSPIGIMAFFTERGLNVLWSEFIWIFLPGLFLAVTAIMARHKYKASIDERIKSPAVSE
ncbi:metal-dependent hydrolase [Aestuariirhabdus sp. Z084]|uniref:metal-dependent hydrolase n=1 Tax=Aestuariirhabdus haliotis TaxID=2918751 RepID=UPI00201B4415|nr:metal-dependent hydrolase [Aestuariirhabdus haliotis]MCL6416419.1 metal-dependent hydrolase [Aestuariirhabdus haliotis]MCL6420415.1 metal-dependent hydrolase [Aestuariirhabdus haliotis]